MARDTLLGPRGQQMRAHAKHVIIVVAALAIGYGFARLGSVVAPDRLLAPSSVARLAATPARVLYVTQSAGFAHPASRSF